MRFYDRVDLLSKDFFCYIWLTCEVHKGWVVWLDIAILTLRMYNIWKKFLKNKCNNWHRLCNIGELMWLAGFLFKRRPCYSFWVGVFQLETPGTTMIFPRFQSWVQWGVLGPLLLFPNARYTSLFPVLFRSFCRCIGSSFAFSKCSIQLSISGIISVLLHGMLLIHRLCCSAA